MNILLVDMHRGIEESLIAMGHTVKSLRLGGGIVNLPGLLKKSAFSPDLVVQMEYLGPKTYFLGLESLDCPTIFWAMDSHLGLYWHKWYARLFDHVLTPHLSLFGSLPAGLRLTNVSRFAWPGEQRDFVPHAKREHFLGLCARVDANRKIRAWLVGLLSGAGLTRVDGLPHAEMMAFYEATRVIPNECIANEVNWRLMEGASAGAMVASPDVGDDQNALLEPGKEFLPYRDGLELLDIITWAKIRPQQAEAVGLAAAKRIQAEHLPVHRAHHLLHVAQESKSRPGGRARGAQASLSLWLALAMQLRGGLLSSVSADEHAAQGLALLQQAQQECPDEPGLNLFAAHVTAQCLCLWAEGENPQNLPKALDLARELVARHGPHAPYARHESAGSGNVAALAGEPGSGENREGLGVASALLLRLGEFSAARALWLAGGAKQGRALPENPPALVMAWAAEQQIPFTLGFSPNAKQGVLPENALGWLYFGRRLAPETALLDGAVENALGGSKSLLLPYVEELEGQRAARPDDWRLGLKYGLACLGALRVDDGLRVLQATREIARKQGREKQFFSRIRSMSPVTRNWEDML